MIAPPRKLVLVRHAESERNKALDGALFINDPTSYEAIAKIPDHKVCLTERGHEQANITAEKLKALVGVPDILFHSGYLRTKQTATGLLKAYAENEVPVKEDLSLREREGGYTHVLMEADAQAHFPYLQNYWEVVGGLFARPVGGESLMDVIEQRLRPFLSRVYAEYSDKTVVLVTHGRVIQCLRFILDEMTWDEMETFLQSKDGHPKNASITIYTKDCDHLKLESWNEIFY